MSANTDNLLKEYSDKDLRDLYKQETGTNKDLSDKAIAAIRKKPGFMKMLIARAKSTKTRGPNKKKKENKSSE